MNRADKREIIARRVAQELQDGDVVNLGIGIPTRVADYVPEEIDITLHSENGFVGLGYAPEAGKEDKNLINAGGEPVTIKKGGAFMNSAESFVLVRGGHLDVTVLGTLQVDEKGNIANWMIPGKFVPGMGGAMDLITGAQRVIVATEHTIKGEKPKILEECTLPLSGKGEVDLIVTEMGVMKVTGKGLVLKEYNPEFELEYIKAKTEADLIVPADLQEMK